MAVISSEERRLIAELITHHYTEAELCRETLQNPGDFTAREIARCTDNISVHEAFTEQLRSILADSL